MQFIQTLTKILFVTGTKYFVNLSVSKFWNIGIGDQSNIGNWSNIGKKILKLSVLVSTK